jgi:hypothetical protein
MRRFPRESVFLNIPYDEPYSNLYFAFIVGLCAFGLQPRATLETATGERRLDRIFELMTGYRYSFHDLSRVQLDRRVPRTPRFNMPFELGLLLGWRKATANNDHSWFIFESTRWRLQKSLSDLDGTDPLIHDGTIDGVFRELSNALVKHQYQPSVEQMRTIYRRLKKASPTILAENRADSPFAAKVFKQFVVLATEYAERTIPR